MAIMPVSTISSGINYNNVSFQGKKSKEENPQKSSNISGKYVKIPLETLMLALTMNTANVSANPRVERDRFVNDIEMVENNVDQTNGKVIQKHSFSRKGGEGFSDYDVSLVDTDGNVDNFEEMYLTSKELNGSTSSEKIKYLDKIKLYLHSDNGFKEGPFDYSQLVTQRSDSSEKNSVVMKSLTDFISKALSSNMNNSDVKEKEVERFFHLNPITYRRLELASKDDIDDAIIRKGPSENDLNLISPQKGVGKVDSVTVQTNNGIYKVRYYSNDSVCKTVTIQKKGGPELILNNLVRIKLNIFSENSNVLAKNMTIHAITVGGPQKAVFTDDLLAEYLAKQNLADDKKEVIKMYMKNIDMISTAESVFDLKYYKLERWFCK